MKGDCGCSERFEVTLEASTCFAPFVCECFLGFQMREIIRTGVKACRIGLVDRTLAFIGNLGRDNY